MRFLAPFAENLRHAVRGLRREPAFTATVLTTFALCLGANVVIFCVVRAVLLAPLPFPHPGKLVTMYNSCYPKAGITRSANPVLTNSVLNYLERRDGGVPAFAEVGAYRHHSTIITDRGPARRLQSTSVTPSFFRVLGMTAARGRLFTEEEAVYGKNNVVVVSDDFWRSELNADPTAIGRTLTFSGGVVTIIGVLPPDFGFLSWAPPLWRPLPFADFERHPASRRLDTVALVARLRPGATIATAQSQIDALNEQRLADDPNAAWLASAGHRTIVAGLHDDHVAGVRPALLLLQAGALVLLLIGVVNIMNLLLIRASARAKERAVRRVLGASRARIAARIVGDTVLLAVIGGVAGLGIGAVALRLVSIFGVDRLPMSRTIALDGTVAATALSAAVVTGLLLALPVVAFSVSGDPARSLNVESRSGTTTRAMHRWRQALIAVQVALAFALLTSAGLLGRSLHRLLAVDLGFQPEHVLTATLMLSNSYNSQAARFSFAERWLEALRRLPGVKSAGLSTTLPVTVAIPTDTFSFWVEGYAPPAGEQDRTHYGSQVGGDYLAALGVPLRAGRLLNADDMQRPARVCVVDEDFAQRYWPEGGALGRHIAASAKNSADKTMTIVGVVGRVKQGRLDDAHARGMVYWPMTIESTSSWMLAVLRTEQPPAMVAPAMREALHQIDPGVPFWEDPEPMVARVSNSVKPQRASRLIAAIFSSVALLLAGVGIYGVLAFAVAQRQREIGIRLALGALPAQIRNLFLGAGFRVLVCGLAVGGIAAWMAGRLMQNFLFGVSAFEPEVFTVAAGVLGLVVLIAALLPAQRAAKVSPLEALRHE